MALLIKSQTYSWVANNDIVLSVVTAYPQVCEFGWVGQPPGFLIVLNQTQQIGAEVCVLLIEGH